jgi:hypothetical protein
MPSALCIISLTIISTQRYPKAAHLETKGWPYYFSMQMMMSSSVCTRGMNMFHPLQDNPESDKQEEDKKAEWGRDDRDGTRFANIYWHPSDD